MKKNPGILLTIAFVLIFSGTASAKIWRLNNNGNGQLPAVTADFPASTTLQQAHDNASVQNGDTLHIEQSPVSYGNCVFAKRLVVIGSGYYLALNSNTQVNTSYGSVVGILTFYHANSASSQVFGLQTSTIYMGVNNLLISRCLINSAVLIGNASTGNIDGMTLRQCIIPVGTSSQGCIRNNTGTGLVTNMNISNNLIVPVLNTFNHGIILDTRVSGILKNNVIQSYYGALSLNNFYVLNNIIHAGTGNTFNNCVVEYNVGLNTAHFVTPAGTNNTIGLGNQIKTLGQIAYVAGSSTDGYYQLAPASEAIGAGKGGANAGAFGGDYPYKLSGIAPVPNIYGLTIAPVQQGAATINVTVTAKGNN